MIPILYDKNETGFTHNGIGFLADTIKEVTTEERNGVNELCLQYPVDGRYFDLIDDSIIKVKASDTGDPQLFRIYKSTKPLRGIVTFYGEHISYDLNGLPLPGFNASGATPLVAINKALEETPLKHAFSAWSDIVTLNTTKIKGPCSVRGLLGGQEGSILDIWGGEYEFDNFTVKLHAHRGEDNGVSIEYGKNLTDIKQERNISECYTHIMPYAVYTRDIGNGESEEVYVYLPERVLPLPNAPSLGHYRAFRYDCSEEFGENEIPTEAKMRIFTNRYIATHDLTSPKVNITVSFINLADTVEYKNIAPLERVRLCDTVTVRFSKLGVNAKAKIIKTVYNGLTEKYESVTIGDAKSNFADTVKKQNTEIAHIISTVAQNKSRAAIETENAIANATAAITGQSGGYVVLNPSEHPQEILILDSQSGGDIEQAVNVWRWNSAGLGHSSDGYDGTYTTAITYDGKIVADFIAAGTLNGNLLRAGSVTADAISQVFKQNITNEITESTSAVRQEFEAADGVLRSSISSLWTTLSTDYSTTAEVQSAITQTADAITTEVNKKVNESDFGTKIRQSATDIQFAFNSISSVIQFENAQMNIYDGNQKKVISFNSFGEDIFFNDCKVGTIGASRQGSDTSKRGIAFHLENDAAYMEWSYRPYPTADFYSPKLTYVPKAFLTYEEDDTLYIGCNVNGEGNHTMKGFRFLDWDFDGRGKTGTFEGNYIATDGSTKLFRLNFEKGVLTSAIW